MNRVILHSKECGWERFIPALIVLSVFVANLPYLFSDLLWHDDNQWYFRATQGITVQQLLPWRGKIASLVPYRDWLYAHSMVNLGLPVTRSIFVMIMAFTSLALFFIYKKSFGFNSRIASLGAIIPNILPGLIGIPVGWIQVPAFFHRK